MPVPMIAIFAMCPSSGSALVRAGEPSGSGWGA